MVQTREISEIKRQIMNLLVHNEDIVAAIDNPEIVDPDDLIYNNFWYSFKVPEVETEKQTYVCIRGDAHKGKGSNLTNDMTIYFLIVTHQDLMKVPRNSVARGCTRIDYIAERIEEMLVGRRDLGFKEIELISSVEDFADSRHPCRIMKFKGACSSRSC